MGPVARRALPLFAWALVAALLWPGTAAAFSGFGTTSADATYGAEMRFAVQLPGGAPDKLELLLRFTGADSTFVAPVEPGASSAEYVWDTSQRPITPNTGVDYQWRGTSGATVTLSPVKHLLYDDDRPGLDWHAARIGDANIHWYGGAEAEARHFGQITANAAAAAETLLGHDLVSPVDIFVYDTRDEFFGALGPGAREWTGAATFPELRTIFMWLGGGSSSYLETTMTHEVTHVVFQDATTNPFHEPPTWFNEGLATWSEEQSASEQVGLVRAAADSGGLLAFDAIRERFPIGVDAARLAYAEGTTMIQMIVDGYGRGGIADIAAAWRDGAGDDEALQAGTGVPVEQLYGDYFASFGVPAPTAVAPAPIPPSNVDKPPQPGASGNERPAPSAAPSHAPRPVEQSGDFGWIAVIVGTGLVAGIGIAVVARRRRPPANPA